MALKEVLNEEHFNKFIHMFEDDLKNNKEPYYRYQNCNSYKMQLVLDLLTAPRPQTFIQVKIKNNETKLEYLKYKMRYNKICSYKLLLHCLKNYLFEYIENFDILNDNNGTDRIVNSDYHINIENILYNSTEYEDYCNKYNYNELSSPLNSTIYDVLLHKTVKEYNSYLKKIPQIINSQKKIVKWYKQQSKVRKTRLLLTSYHQLNKRKFQLPNDIICNKILKLNY